MKHGKMGNLYAVMDQYTRAVRKRLNGAAPGHAAMGGAASVLAGLILCCALGAPKAWSYDLTPIYEETQNRLDSAAVPVFLRPAVKTLLGQFSDPAHEGLTAMMFGCTAAIDRCGDDPENFVPQGVLDGLRWNDNPIFRVSTTSRFCPRSGGTPIYIELDSDPICWVTLFNDAGKSASGTPGEHFSGATGSVPIALIYRIHFGDLQFIHGMASWDGEIAQVTHDHMLAWAELMYKLHDGELAQLDAPIGGQVKALEEIFANNGFSARSLITPQALATPSNDTGLRDMALGSLLHLIEDSYSGAHTDRAPGPGQACAGMPGAPVPGQIKAFYSYTHQDSNRHKARDASTTAASQLTQPVTVVEVGKQVLSLFSEHKTWAEAAPYFACVFALADPSVQAGPGPFAK